MNWKMVIFLLITMLCLVVVSILYSPVIYHTFAIGFLLGGIDFAIYKELQDNEY